MDDVDDDDVIYSTKLKLHGGSGSKNNGGSIAEGSIHYKNTIFDRLCRQVGHTLEINDFWKKVGTQPRRNGRPIWTYKPFDPKRGILLLPILSSSLPINFGKLVPIMSKLFVGRYILVNVNYILNITAINTVCRYTTPVFSIYGNIMMISFIYKLCESKTNEISLKQRVRIVSEHILTRRSAAISRAKTKLSPLFYFPNVIYS